MNAAARAVHGGRIHDGLHNLILNKEALAVVLLAVAVLISSFAVVYVKNTDRRLYNELQVVQHQSEKYKVAWGQLALEQSTWATPARVQHVAQQYLDMELPQRVVMVDL